MRGEQRLLTPKAKGFRSVTGHKGPESSPKGFLNLWFVITGLEFAGVLLGC